MPLVEIRCNKCKITLVPTHSQPTWQQWIKSHSLRFASEYIHAEVCTCQGWHHVIAEARVISPCLSDQCWWWNKLWCNWPENQATLTPYMGICTSGQVGLHVCYLCHTKAMLWQDHAWNADWDCLPNQPVVSCFIFVLSSLHVMKQ